jgi:hypothetical protein
MNPLESGDSRKDDSVKGMKRPLVLSLLCLFSFVFFGLIAVLFLLSDIYSGRIAEVLNHYITGTALTTAGVAGITTGGFILHAACVAGCILMWRMKRGGYYIFGISALLISLYQLFRNHVPMGTTVVYILLIVLFGLFYRKMVHFNKKV